MISRTCSSNSDLGLEYAHINEGSIFYTKTQLSLVTAIMFDILFLLIYCRFCFPHKSREDCYCQQENKSLTPTYLTHAFSIWQLAQSVEKVRPVGHGVAFLYLTQPIFSEKIYFKNEAEESVSKVPHFYINKRSCVNCQDNCLIC